MESDGTKLNSFVIELTAHLKPLTSEDLHLRYLALLDPYKIRVDNRPLKSTRTTIEDFEKEGINPTILCLQNLSHFI